MRAGRSGDPQTSSTRAHSSRSARNLARLMNSSASAARRKAIDARAAPREARSLERAPDSRARPTSAKASSCAGEPPAAWTQRASAATNGPAKPRACERSRELAEAPRRLRPIFSRLPAARQGAERIEAEGKIERCRDATARFARRRGDRERLRLGRRAEVESQRQPRVEADALEQRVEEAASASARP